MGRRRLYQLLIPMSCAAAALCGCGAGGSSSAGITPPPQVPAFPLTIVAGTTSLLVGNPGYPFNGGSSGFTIAAAGGIMPYKWSWAPATGSTFPPGLSISTTSDGHGAISGIPTANGTYNMVVTVSDAEQPVAKISATYAIQIADPGPLADVSGDLPIGLVGQSYLRGPCAAGNGSGVATCPQGVPLIVSGGIPPFTWTWIAAAGSSLPPGLSIATGTIGASGGASMSPPIIGAIVGGSPTTPGTYDVIVNVTDSEVPAKTVATNRKIQIFQTNPPFVNNPPAPLRATLHQPYSLTFTTGLALQFPYGGSPPFTFSGTGLPAGFTLSSQGVLAGTPMSAGTFTISVAVQDSLGQTLGPQDFPLQVFAHGFSATGGLEQTGLYVESATLLGNGKVLVTEGSDGSFNPAGKAELYDPAAGTFSVTGSMVTPRWDYLASVLVNGKVLIAGGFGGTGFSNQLATAEIYDPGTGTFSPTNGQMTVARNSATATLLNNGEVLIAGGGTPAGLGSTAELYDPGTGTFSATGSMAVARDEHTATLLPNGKVLVAGGAEPLTGQTNVPDAEIYDPATGTFSPAGGMTTPRYSHTATLLANGAVLLVGGSVVSGGGSLATAEIFDPATQLFTATPGNMEAGRTNHSATLLPDGTVLLTGGIGNGTPGQLKVLGTAELYDLVTNTFSPAASMAGVRCQQSATLLQNGDVLVVAGRDAQAAPLSTAELYK